MNVLYNIKKRILYIKHKSIMRYTAYLFQGIQPDDRNGVETGLHHVTAETGHARAFPHEVQAFAARLPRRQAFGVLDGVDKIWSDAGLQSIGLGGHR